MGKEIARGQFLMSERQDRVKTLILRRLRVGSLWVPQSARCLELSKGAKGTGEKEL